ncbi:uncharacterized protein GLRG_01476 [Colletotrichum graminicola M1.001]|uniref:GRF-type domain-containing protein n=1 Tax=Colletotrichum graminicola (strain M1.001 / M2 / FGSC 10212) TaxID=645133 RepID=E3Q684_COLGM|nr:uncharacterized protein GLRG_01476 [Colletotrichum graminicola M1.001]EFQ26332.1 hypothetical protein GLRG_01476 [Colletotrichum graminicola M1.001]
MVSRTPRGSGRRLMYNSNYSRSSAGGSASRSRTHTPRSGRHTAGETGSSPSPPPSQKRRLDGLYLEGNWYCNCTPRQQAAHLQVKKKNANNGRFFYKCEKRRGGCTFFLWEEDAKNRDEGSTLTLPPMPTDGAPAAGTIPTAQLPTPSTASAIKNASRPATAAATAAPPSPSAQRSVARQKFLDTYFSTTRQTQAALEADGPPDEAGAEASPRPAKRKRVLFDFDSDDGADEYGLGDVSSDEERAMNEAMERSARKLRGAAPPLPPPSPSTPAAQRTVRDGAALPTPQTVTRTLFPDAKRPRHDDAGQSPNTSFSTSTSTATGDAGLCSSTPSRGEEQLDPTEEVLALLAGQKVDDATARAVGDVLRRFSMQAKGLARGRETVRAALKAKDEKIAALQERVASLEARTRAQREEIADFKAGMMDLYSKH